MKLSKFMEAIAGLPADAQRLANKAMLYTAFAMQNTERQVLTNTGGNDTGAVVRTMSGGGALNNMKSGLVTEQTKKYSQKFKMIMEHMDRYQPNGGQYISVDAEGNPYIDVTSNLGSGSFLTEEAYSNKQMEDARAKTDLRDDYPIELDWQAQRIRLNEADMESKDMYMNVALERRGGAMVRIEDYLVSAHVKQLPSWSSHPKLLEFYTNIQRPMPQFDALQTTQGVEAIAGNISMAVLTKTSHQGDEIYGYRVREFDKCVIHNGQLVYKFFVEEFVK